MSHGGLAEDGELHPRGLGKSRQDHVPFPSVTIMIAFQGSRGWEKTVGSDLTRMHLSQWITQISEKRLPIGDTNEKGRCSGGATALRKTGQVNSP